MSEARPGTPALDEVPILWLTAGLSCDGDSIAMTAATQPSIEDLVSGTLPGVPRIRFHHPVLAYEVGEDFLAVFHAAAAGELPPFLLIVEGSVPNEALSGDGCWAALGTDPETGQPISTCQWIDRLAPRAWGVVAVGTCAAFGGIHGVAGNPTGAMGLADYLGWEWRSSGGLPIVNVPGCPVQPDNCTETMLYLLRQMRSGAPSIPLDPMYRPTWLFGHTAHEGCNRGAFYEQGDFADEFGSSRCIVKLGCWGPVSDCNVGKRGWVNGVGGCANVGGTCIGCTMPGFPDKFIPFLDEPPAVRLSTTAVLLDGRTAPGLRNMTRAWMNLEPEWRRPGPHLTSGYEPRPAEVEAEG